MINMLTRTDIEKKHAPVIVKWGKALVDDNGNATEGIMEGKAKEFLTRIENESRLLGMLRYIEMEGETQDIQTLRVNPKLKNLNKISGAGKGMQVDDIRELTETEPELLKEKLVAQPFTAYTTIKKSFMATNIEKQAFIAKYESLLAPGCAFSAEQIAIFGKNTQEDDDGLHALDGILTQLDTIAGGYLDGTTHLPKNVKAAQGHYGVHWNADSSETDKTEFIDIKAGEGYNVLPQLDAMLDQFTAQKGKRRLAHFLVSSKMESTIIAELGVRETERGDKLTFDEAGNVTYRGRSIIQLDALDEPENGYNDIIILCNPDSVGYGPLMEAESEADYYVFLKAYLTTVDMMFDVGIIFPQDILYANVDYTAKE